MGLFNFNRNKNKAQTSAETATSWEQMAQSAAPAQEADLERERKTLQNQERQERKAIGMILYGEGAITSSGDYIGASDRIRAYEQINSGQFGPAEQSAILRKIAPPNKARGGSSEAVFAQMGDKHSRTILAFVNGMDGSQETLWNMPSTTIDTTLSRYPTPVEFNIKATEMIDRLRAHNPESKVQEYVRDLETFKRQLYGKRQEYYEAFQRLEADAAKRASTQSKRNDVLDAIHGTTPATKGQYAYPEEDLGYLSPEMQEAWRIPPSDDDTPLMPEYRTPPSDDDTPLMPEYRTPAIPDDDTPLMPEYMSPSRRERIDKPVEVFYIDHEDAERFLREGKVDGDPFMKNGEAIRLTTEMLEDMGLAPEYKFELDDRTEIAFSKVYATQGGRGAVTAYVRTPQGTRVVSYYRSNSQGTWRYLPDYIAPDNSDGKGLEWFGKGYDEESLNLPIASQQALEIVNAQPHLETDEDTSLLLAFAGTAKRYNSKTAYGEAKRNQALRGAFYEEVSHTPYRSFGQINHSKVTPESLNLVGSVVPDFNQPSAEFSFNSGIYGTVNSEHYRSIDRSLTWTFNRNQRGYAWIGGVEMDSPVSSVGIRTKWAQVGDYGTPLYEYSSMANGYGDPGDVQGHYTNMWRNYLSRMPIIQKYLAHKAREGGQ